jgi:hypothetical protein
LSLRVVVMGDVSAVDVARETRHSALRK